MCPLGKGRGTPTAAPCMFPTGHRIKDKEGEPKRKHLFHVLLLLQLRGGPAEQCPRWDRPPLLVCSHCRPCSHGGSNGNMPWRQSPARGLVCRGGVGGSASPRSGGTLAAQPGPPGVRRGLRKVEDLGPERLVEMREVF